MRTQHTQPCLCHPRAKAVKAAIPCRHGTRLPSCMTLGQFNYCRAQFHHLQNQVVLGGLIQRRTKKGPCKAISPCNPVLLTLLRNSPDTSSLQRACLPSPCFPLITFLALLSYLLSAPPQLACLALPWSSVLSPLVPQAGLLSSLSPVRYCSQTHSSNLASS